MNKEITAQVVMLPTNSNNSHIGILKRNIDIINPLIYNSVGIFNTFAWSSQHLYFTTDEPIQEGDWCYSIRAEVIFQAPDLSKELLGSGVRKIIASTDPALGLPAIPTAWIRDIYVPSNGSFKEVKLSIVGEEVLVTHRALGITKDYLKLTLNNEVVIVDEPVERTEENFPEEYMLSAKELQEYQVDQELENAGLKWFKDRMMSGRGVITNKEIFNAGATWQKEQSANDAIELLNWLRDDETDYFLLTNWIQTKKSSKEVYELWLQSKNNS